MLCVSLAAALTNCCTSPTAHHTFIRLHSNFHNDRNNLDKLIGTGYREKAVAQHRTRALLVPVPLLDTSMDERVR